MELAELSPQGVRRVKSDQVAQAGAKEKHVEGQVVSRRNDWDFLFCVRIACHLMGRHRPSACRVAAARFTRLNSLPTEGRQGCGCAEAHCPPLRPAGGRPIVISNRVRTMMG